MRYENEYNEYLDELYDVGIWSFSKLLQDSDPIAYNVGYDDFIDSQGLDEDAEDSEDEENEDLLIINNQQH